MSFPKKFKIGTRTWEVRLVPKTLLDFAAQGRQTFGTDPTILGQTLTREAQIWIWEDLKGYELKLTLLHEILHAIYPSTDTESIIIKDPEEYAVSTLESPLFEFMRQNPKVISYLLQEED